MAQEYPVGALQEPQDCRDARQEAEWPKDGNNAPHRSKGCSSRQDLAVLLGMKPGKKRTAINWAIDWGTIGNIDKFDSVALIETSHDRDLFAA